VCSLFDKYADDRQSAVVGSMDEVQFERAPFTVDDVLGLRMKMELNEVKALIADERKVAAGSTKASKLTARRSTSSVDGPNCGSRAGSCSLTAVAVSNATGDWEVPSLHVEKLSSRLPQLAGQSSQV
jgi:hypothetical protein